MTAENNDLYHDQESEPIFQTPAVYTRQRPWGLRDDDRLAQMDASTKYELLRVLDLKELRNLAGRYGIWTTGLNRQQLIASIIGEEVPR